MTHYQYSAQYSGKVDLHIYGLAIDGFSFFRLVHFMLAVINWVVIPGLALLLGIVPLLKTSARAKI